VIDLRLGRWEDVLADVERVDAVITDTPFSKRTHAKQRHGRRDSRYADGWVTARGLEYDFWAPEDVARFVDSWAPRCCGWFCAFTSHDLAPAWEGALKSHDRYVFAPLPGIQHGRNVRLVGDGPANWTDWLIVARPRCEPWSTWGALPGFYYGQPGRGPERAKFAVAGAKPPWLMRAIIRDYTRPGMLIADPCAGGATTLLEAARMGRNAIGSEMDPETHTKAQARLDAYRREAATQPDDLFAVPTEHTRGRQQKLEIPR
jgi:hypothetical protein